MPQMKRALLSRLLVPVALLLPAGELMAKPGGDDDRAARIDAQQSPDQEWRNFVAVLKELPERIPLEPLSNDPGYKADFYLTTLMTVVQAALATAQQDPVHPDWIPFTSKSIPIIAPNPDNVYHVARIDSAGTYRISGHRGTVRLVDIQISQGLWGLVDQPSPTILNIDLDDQKINADGTFELILSAERPADFTGNWIKLEPRADYLFVRQLAYDWENEADARLAIERMDIPARKGRPSPQWIAEQIAQSSRFTERLMAFNRANDQKVHRQAENTLHKLGGESNAAALNLKQAYYQGRFNVAEGQAVILDTNVPQCKYWSLQITDNWGNTIDYMHRQSSLNGFTAIRDADGRLRVVLSPQDPGVPNWIDTSGYPSGRLLTRWYDCDGEPEQVLRKVPFAHLRGRLPKDTPGIDEAQREANLHARIRGAQLRRRW